MIRDGLDAALLDIATFYRDVMMVQSRQPRCTNQQEA
jgi:hypothetical protein